MANKIDITYQEATGIKRYRHEVFDFETDGGLTSVIDRFSKGSWHCDGTFSLGGKVVFQFSNDKSATGQEWTKELVAGTMTESGDFIEYLDGSFLFLRITAEGFEGKVFGKLEGGV